jgi:hypothetical protein
MKSDDGCHSSNRATDAAAVAAVRRHVLMFGTYFLLPAVSIFAVVGQYQGGRAVRGRPNLQVDAVSCVLLKRHAVDLMLQLYVHTSRSCSSTCRSRPAAARDAAFVSIRWSCLRLTIFRLQRSKKQQHIPRLSS